MSTDLAELVKASLIRALESLRDAIRDLAAPLDERQFWLKPLEPGNSFGHLDSPTRYGIGERQPTKRTSFRERSDLRTRKAARCGSRNTSTFCASMCV